MEEVPADKFDDSGKEAKDYWFDDAVEPGPGVGGVVDFAKEKL